MSLARVAQAVQHLVLAHGRLAPAAVQSCGQPAVARFFASGYLDRNDVTERILSKVKSFDKVESSKVSTSSSFKDLGLDSLDTVELVMAMEEEFSIEIPDEDADSIQTVDNAVEYFSNHPHAK